MEMIEEFIEQIPKVELHVHLEGSVQPQTLLKLANRYNVDLRRITLRVYVNGTLFVISTTFLIFIWQFLVVYVQRKTLS